MDQIATHDLRELTPVYRTVPRPLCRNYVRVGQPIFHKKTVMMRVPCRNYFNTLRHETERTKHRIEVATPAPRMGK